jgi:hypothetical protein
MILGKAKSRKTFFVTIMLAAWVRNGLVLNKVQGSLPPDQRMLLHFDTEQGGFHVQRAAQRVLRLAGKKQSGNYQAFGLRRFDPDTRLALIEHAIYNTPGLGVVVIDGIRDLAALGINDEQGATELTSRLLRWTEEKQIHVVVVLHQNKNDGNARGHLGTELVNKAETVLSVTKDAKAREMSTVEALFTRDIDPEPFGFEIAPDGLPQLTQARAPMKANKPNSKEYRPADYADSFHLGRLKMVFAQKGMLGYTEFCKGLKEVYGVGDNIVKQRLVPYMQEQEREWVKKSGTAYYLANTS